VLDGVFFLSVTDLRNAECFCEFVFDFNIFGFSGLRM
jgi:hypothetical protein